MQRIEADHLLDATPLRLETGYERQPGGVLHIACRTDLHGCTGEMFEWSFQWRCDTQKYIWWHPVDHVYSDWLGGSPGTHVGSTHRVEEYFTGLPSEKLLIQFRENAEFFDAGKYTAARAAGRVSASVCGRVGFGWEAPALPAGRLLGGRLLHIARDTIFGRALRSHFFIGQDLPALRKSPADVEAMATDEFGQAVLMHCYNEFTFLSRFLPLLFIAENRAARKVHASW